MTLRFVCGQGDSEEHLLKDKCCPVIAMASYWVYKFAASRWNIGLQAFNRFLLKKRGSFFLLDQYIAAPVLSGAKLPGVQSLVNAFLSRNIILYLIWPPYARRLNSSPKQNTLCKQRMCVSSSPSQHQAHALLWLSTGLHSGNHLNTCNFKHVSSPVFAHMRYNQITTSLIHDGKGGWDAIIIYHSAWIVLFLEVSSLPSAVTFILAGLGKKAKTSKCDYV